MVEAMQKVGAILAQPPLTPIPSIPPSLITADTNILPVRFPEKAGIALIRTQQEIEIVDLGNMQRISRYQSSAPPSMMGSMSPNGRLFTTADGDQLSILDTRTGTVIAGIPSVLPWMFHWLDERTAFYVNGQLQSFFIDFVSGKFVPTGLRAMPLSYATRIPDKHDQYAVMDANKVFKFELVRKKPMPDLKLLVEKPVGSLMLASNTSGTTSDGKYFFDIRSHLTLINLVTFESEEISLEPFYFQKAIPAPNPDNLIVTGFIQPHDGSVPPDYLYSIRNRSLAQIRPAKQDSSLRQIYINPLHKLGIISDNQITLMGSPQTAGSSSLSDFAQKVAIKSEQNKVAIAEKQQALENSCHPSKETNKDGIELHAIGIYKGPLGQEKSLKNKVNIAVYAAKTPIVLALFSYEKVTWNISLAPGATLKEVILKSSDGIQLTGAKSKSVKVTRPNLGYTAYEDCDFFRRVAPKLKEFSGLNVTSFQGEYRGTGFPIRSQDQPALPVTVTDTRILKSPPGLDEGLAAFDKGDYRTALDKLTTLAAKGNAIAMNTLGKMYMQGLGVPQDYGKALQLFRQAAKRKLPNAENNLGVMYAGGYGVPQDFRQAIAWFKKAANQGYAGAINNLAEIHEKDVFVSKDPIEAEKWRHKLKGSTPEVSPTLVNIGFVGDDDYKKAQDYYYSGRFREAIPLFLNAAEKGHPEAQLKLAAMYRYGQSVEKDERQARHWEKKASAQGYSDEDGRDRIYFIDSSADGGDGAPAASALTATAVSAESVGCRCVSAEQPGCCRPPATDR